MNPIQAAMQVLPISNKHHRDFKMVLLPTKFPFLLVNDKYEVVRNVADYQWKGVIKCDPGLLARNFGITATPIAWPESPDHAKWLIVLSYKSVPLAEVLPVTMPWGPSSCAVVNCVRTLDVESFNRYSLLLKG